MGAVLGAVLGAEVQQMALTALGETVLAGSGDWQWLLCQKFTHRSGVGEQPRFGTYLVGVTPSYGKTEITL